MYSNRVNRGANIRGRARPHGTPVKIPEFDCPESLIYIPTSPLPVCPPEARQDSFSRGLRRRIQTKHELISRVERSEYNLALTTTLPLDYFYSDEAALKYLQDKFNQIVARLRYRDIPFKFLGFPQLNEDRTNIHAHYAVITSFDFGVKKFTKTRKRLRRMWKKYTDEIGQELDIRIRYYKRGWASYIFREYEMGWGHVMVSRDFPV